MILSIILANLLAKPVVSKGEVTYTIPAMDGMRAPLMLGIENASFDQSHGLAVMHFSLPAMLTGADNKSFKLSGKLDGSSILMQGDGANAICKNDRLATECQIKFDALTIDHEAADLLIDPELSAPIADAIKAGREAFEHQAVGVIRFEHGQLASHIKEYQD